MYSESNHENSIWQQLEQGIWPHALNNIKPKQWDSADYRSREKLVWANLVYIIHHTKQLSQTSYIPKPANWANESSLYP